MGKAKRKTRSPAPAQPKTVTVGHACSVTFIYAVEENQIHHLARRHSRESGSDSA